MAMTHSPPRQSTVCLPYRKHDYLYDPTFYVSSSTDHAKESFKSQTSMDRIRYVPNFKTMFSSLRHYPRQSVTLDMTDPVPYHVSRQWKGYPDQAREALIRYKQFNYDPNIQVPQKYFEPPEVDGRNRYKYFRRPIIPFLPQMPPNIVLAPTRVDPLQPPSASILRDGGLFSGPPTRSVLVQTDYRESEAQTDPYSPEYVIKPGSQPELLTLASLSYGRGLPAGLAEVEMIERARAKREWEASLPPLDDLDQMDKRRRMMEQQERKEWAFRESEIKKMQEERMEVVKDMLMQREADYQALDSKRLEYLWNKKQIEQDRKFRRLHNEHVKALRKLTKDSSNVERKFKQRKVIEQYSNFDSQVYAPMTRIGVYLDSGSEQYNVKNRFNTTLEGLMELEDNISFHVLEPSVTVPVRSVTKAVGMAARRQMKLSNVLDEVHSELIRNKTKGKEVPKPLSLLKKVEKPKPRPPTPTVPTLENDEEEEELALILLQRIIRGRAVQNKMFEGKERRYQLIQELRTTHALQAPEHSLQKEEADMIRRKQADQQEALHKENLVQDSVESPAALVLGRRLDFLNKELVRLQEEQRVAAFVMLAERQRRMREAEESGRRQQEERLRRTEDEVFKQMMRVHQGSVDTYLEDVILKSLEQTAGQQAREEISKRAETINQLAHKFEHTELSGKEFVAELVHSFLLPEVEKQTLREKVHQNQKKYLLAAHRVVHNKVSEILKSSPDQTPPIQVTSTSSIEEASTQDTAPSDFNL